MKTGHIEICKNIFLIPFLSIFMNSVQIMGFIFTVDGVWMVAR